MATPLILREILSEDCKIIHEAFKLQGWEKSVSQFQKYLEYQQERTRDIIIAEYNKVFAGYLTIKWESDYIPFRDRKIPEIVDFNVLEKYQRLKIGTALVDEAERRIKKVSQHAGIGVGLTKDYGAAQIFYVKRNYLPDGNGIIVNSESLSRGDKIALDDSVAFYLIKEL